MTPVKEPLLQIEKKANCFALRNNLQLVYALNPTKTYLRPHISFSGVALKPEVCFPPGAGRRDRPSLNFAIGTSLVAV